MVTLGSGRLVLYLRWPDGEPDFSRPPVRQLERLAHVELQYAEAPRQILQGPNDGMLHLRRGPLSELVVTQVRLQGSGNARGELAVWLLGSRRRRPLGSLALSWSLLGPCPIAPEHPLQRGAHQAPLPRPGHDQPRHIRRKFLALRPLLDGGFRHRGTEFGCELAVGQGDPSPGAEGVQEASQSLRYGALFSSFYGLDRCQFGPRLVT